MSDLEEITLSHVDSQLNFFFRYNSEDYKEKCRREKRRIDNEIRQVVGAKTSCDPCIPAINSIVGFLHFKWLRWVRARVQEKKNSGAYVLFLLDYGHEVTNADVARFIELPERLKRKSTTVCRGALGLRPCEQVKDRKTNEMITTPVRYYNAEAVKIVQKLNEPEFAKLFFECKETLGDGTLVGDITVKTMQETYNVAERLIAKGLAMRKKQDEVLAAPRREQPSENVSNFEKIIEVVCPNIPSTSERKEAKAPGELAAGANLGSCTNQLKEVSPSTAAPTRPTTNETSSRPLPCPPSLSQPNKPLQSKLPSASKPSDIVLFGERLLPPLQSISNSQFNKNIGEELKSNLKVLSKVQAHCWPQIAEGRSMVIIGRNKSDLTSPYLAPILDALSQSTNGHSSPGIGPIAIIITKSSSDVKRIAQLSSQCAEQLVVVEVCGVDNKIEDLMCGCDLLVSTAPALTRMIDGISFTLFDKTRIKHVVFDHADELLEPFESEINEIIRMCTYGRKMTETNPQMIVTANNWVKNIESKLMSLIHQDNLVICFEDFVEAAAYVKCLDGTGMKFVANDEEKISKLVETLQTESYKSLRTAVVTNDDSSSKILVERLAKMGIQVSPADDVNCKTVKSQWVRELQRNYSVLIASDSALRQMELTSVQNLVHFSIPKSWQSFSRRFGSMIDQFYQQMVNKKLKVAKTTILLDNDNNLEFTQLVKFLARSVEIPAAALDAVKLISHYEELCKVEGKVAICNNIWMFGECKKQTCPSRHTFTDSDKPLAYIPTDSLIKFDFVSMKTPTSYMIKIKSRLRGTNWISWDEKNDEIEKVLEKDFQDFCNVPSNCKPADLLVGEVYALKRDERWFRCRIIEKKTLGLVEVSLIDDGTSVNCVAAKLVELPERFNRLEPLCHNLQIMNLVPFDHGDFYDDESKRVARETVEEAAKGCTFICKVQMAVRDIMFTDSFDAKDDGTGSIKLRLKSKLVKKNVCSIDESVVQKLRILQLGHQHEEKKQFTAPSSAQPMPEPIKSFAASPDQATWKKLSWDFYYDAHVKHFKNPESFLVVLDSSDSKLHQAALQDISSSSVTVPLSELEIKAGIICAVRGESTRRGKIMKANEDDVDILLVDYGEIISCNKSNLFVLPEHLITKIPFQTIHCCLMGVRPKYNMNIWPGKQIQAIQALLQENKTPLRMIVKKTNPRAKDELMSIGMNCYDVTLANNLGENLSDVAVARKFVDEVKKSVAAEEEDEIPDGTNIDLLRRLLEQMYVNKECSDEESGEEEFQDASDEPKPVVDLVESPPSPDELPRPQVKVKFVNKHPKIEWRQNEDLIHLLISAVDCDDYALECTDTSMTIGIKYIDGRYEKTALQFYNSVDVSRVSHELRGLNVNVRLFKKNPHIEWRRLTASNERSQFIKFSTAKISVEAEEESGKASHQLSSNFKRYAMPDGFEDISDCEDLCSSDDE